MVPLHSGAKIAGIAQYVLDGKSVAAQFATFDAEHCGSKYLPCLGIDDCLEKTAGFVHFECAGDVGHRHARDVNGATASPSLLFGQADASKLRIDEDRVRHGPTFDASVGSFEQVRLQDAVVVVRDVRKSGAGSDVTYRVDPRY